MKKEENRLLEKNISKLIECFNNIQHLPDITPYSNWISFISSNDFSFVSHLTYIITTNDNQPIHNQLKSEIIDNTLLILKYLSQHHSYIISSYTINNPSFSKYLHSHFINNKPPISDNFFYFYIQILPSIEINELIIMNLFNSLHLLNDDSIIKDVIYFILNLKSKPHLESILYKIHHSNQYAHLFDELILQILHKEINNEKQRWILRFIISLMNYEDKCFLYGNDLECFIDIVIEKLNCEQELEFKLVLLDCLVKITQYDEYFHKLYKLEELTDLMEDYQGQHEDSIEVKNKSKEIIINIIDHRRMLH